MSWKQKLTIFPGSYKPSPFLQKHSHALTAGTARARLLTSFDIYNCEEPDPRVTVHTPLLSLTVWLAAMVHEPSVIALWASINDSILEWEERKIRNTVINIKINNKYKNKLLFVAQTVAAQFIHQERINQYWNAWQQRHLIKLVKHPSSSMCFSRL